MESPEKVPSSAEEELTLEELLRLEYVTISQIAKSQGVTYRTARLWIAQGLIKAYEFRGRVRVDPEEFRKFIQAETKAHTPTLVPKYK